MGEKVGRLRERKDPAGGEVVTVSPTSCILSRSSAS